MLALGLPSLPAGYTGAGGAVYSLAWACGPAFSCMFAYARCRAVRLCGVRLWALRAAPAAYV